MQKYIIEKTQDIKSLSGAGPTSEEEEFQKDKREEKRKGKITEQMVIETEGNRLSRTQYMRVYQSQDHIISDQKHPRGPAF